MVGIGRLIAVVPVANLNFALRQLFRPFATLSFGADFLCPSAKRHCIRLASIGTRIVAWLRAIERTYTCFRFAEPASLVSTPMRNGMNALESFWHTVQAMLAHTHTYIGYPYKRTRARITQYGGAHHHLTMAQTQILFVRWHKHSSRRGCTAHTHTVSHICAV